MGYFTWTLANKKEETNKYGDYRSRCKLSYGGYGAVVTPDNQKIEADHYDGYGIFGRYDVYDLVVDWNRDYLEEIFDRLKKENPDGFWGDNLRELAIAYQNHDDAKVEEQIRIVSDEMPFLREDWKRNIGITIACDDENNNALPYPIKIVDCRRNKPSYDKLHPSHSCQ